MGGSFRAGTTPRDCDSVVSEQADFLVEQIAQAASLTMIFARSCAAR